MHVLGFMTGTSLDAVDMAVLETDGEAIQGFGPAGERRLTERTRRIVLEATATARAWPRGESEPAVFAKAARAVAEEHLAAGESFLAEHGLGWDDVELVGLQGQTVLHERPLDGVAGRTVQLIDADWLAARIGRPIGFDFRSADVAAGGQGAPLAPIYHVARARASGIEPPLAVLNIGGVANVTMILPGDELLAFDTGPGNGMIDLLVQERGYGRFDVNGELARAGAIDRSAIQALLAHPYLKEPPPKSLDRYDISLEPVRRLSLEDAAATLTAFTVSAIAMAWAWIETDQRPKSTIVSGGGRRNPEIMSGLRQSLANVSQVMSAEDVGWRGDAIEAEAFAYLAARAGRGLPISFPTTTGVPEPMTGGRIVSPPEGAPQSSINQRL
jgi:anhydro-N-acetylmuramic acid kinase